MTASRLITAALAATVMSLFVDARPASAHEPGMSAVLLDIGDHDVTADLQLPLDRLEIAVDLPLAEHPDLVVEDFGDLLGSYIADHLSVTGTDGTAWAVGLGPLRVEPIDGVDHLVTTATLAPPNGEVTDFTLDYDVIIEYLQSHEVVVAAGRAGSDRVVVGTIDFVTDRITVDHTTTSGSFTSMLRLGFDHVLDGADHLLFLVVLLIPAPLLITADRRWGGLGRPRSSLIRVVQVATAFTVGHSLTLLAAAVGWVSAPSGPVEVAVAVSIAVGAVHAVRPIVVHGEALIAAGFGLVHGLAFAGILDDYGLGSSTTATALLGFNLGVELAQLVTIALVFPSLYVLGRTSLSRAGRVAIAAVALLVALGWVVERVSSWTSPFSPAEDWAVAHPFEVVGTLALGALVAALLDRSQTDPNARVDPTAPTESVSAHLREHTTCADTNRLARGAAGVSDA